MSFDRLDKLLDALDVDAEPAPRPSDDEIARARSAGPVPMPPELEHVYRRAYEVYLPQGASIFGLLDYVDVNRQQHLFERLPGVAFFGSDGSDGFFFIDVGGALGHSPGAVFWVSRGNLQPDACVPCGWHLVDFLAKVVAGEVPWDGPSLMKTSVQRMTAALDARPDGWDAMPPVAPEKIDQHAWATMTPITPVTEKLLLRGERIRFVASGVVIGGLEAITPVAGTADADGIPSAVWVGSGPDGTRYAVTAGGWRDLPRDRLIAVPPGGTAETGRVMGLFSDVVTAWVEGRTPPGGTSRG